MIQRGKSVVASVGRFARRRKKLSLFLGVVILIIIASSVWSALTKPSPYTQQKAVRADVTELISESGKITAAGVVPIYSTTNGIVDEVYVKNGDVVSDEQALFHVKSTATIQEKDEARSSYMAAKSTLDAAQATKWSLQADMFSKWDTFKELAESDEFENSDGSPKDRERAVPEFHIPQKEWLAAEANYKNQDVVIAQKSAAASAAWQAYQATQDSEVHAVIGGVIRNLGVAVGDGVAVPTATTINSIAPSMLVVDDQSQTMLKITVNENDVVKIKPGQKAEVTLDSIAGKSFKAVVDRVDTVSVSQTDAAQYSVYIKLTDNTSQIRRGATADVDVIVAKKSNVLTVPNAAIKPYKGGKAVRVVGKNNTLEYKPVTIGARGNTRTEVVSGLEEGDMVVTASKTDKPSSSGGFF